MVGISATAARMSSICFAPKFSDSLTMVRLSNASHKVSIACSVAELSASGTDSL